MFDFSRQVVIVTGAAGPLGQAVARAFVDAGATAVLVDHRAGRLEALYPEWAASSAHYLADEVDLAEPAQMQRTVDETLRRYGRVDVLINTAGGYVGGKTVAEGGMEIWDDAIRRNLLTAVVASKAVLPQMLERQHGCIVNIAARQALQGTARNAAYSASKSALLRFTESLAAEVKGAGVRVNCVLPGTIDTLANRESMPKADPTKWATPESLAGVILFLASPLAQDIHGAAIPVYGRA